MQVCDPYGGARAAEVASLWTGVAWCPWGRWESDPMKSQLGAWWAGGPDVCVCLHASVSLFVSPCVPTASLVRNSWLPPSATPLHQQCVYVVYVCFPCVAGLFLLSITRYVRINVISTDLRGYIELKNMPCKCKGSLLNRRKKDFSVIYLWY